MKEWKQSIVLSLGGSLVIPNGGFDISFLQNFNAFIRRHIENDRRFFIIVGGGATTRQYQSSAKKADSTVQNEDLDWLGIHTTRLNAHLIRTILRDIARPQIINQYDTKEDVGDFPVVIGAGWKPGWSTDYCAISLCKHYLADVIVNMTNTDRVYTKDPNKHDDAEPINHITWEKYRAMIGDSWSPGLSTAFDPVASRLADEMGIKVIILDGRKLENLENVLDGREFVGTTIE